MLMSRSAVLVLVSRSVLMKEGPLESHLLIPRPECANDA